MFTYLNKPAAERRWTPALKVNSFVESIARARCLQKSTLNLKCFSVYTDTWVSLSFLEIKQISPYEERAKYLFKSSSKQSIDSRVTLMRTKSIFEICFKMLKKSTIQKPKPREISAVGKFRKISVRTVGQIRRSLA